MLAVGSLLAAHSFWGKYIANSAAIIVTISLDVRRENALREGNIDLMVNAIYYPVHNIMLFSHGLIIKKNQYDFMSFLPQSML